MVRQEIAITSEADIKKVLKIMMATSDVSTFAEVARALDVNETTFRSALDNGSIRLRDFIKTAGLLGYNVTVKPEE